jgi:hypothetical protein
MGLAAVEKTTAATPSARATAFMPRTTTATATATRLHESTRLPQLYQLLRDAVFG